MTKTSKKILIVEDDTNFVSILKQKFEEEGFITVTAEDGKEGLGVSEKEKPDLIISDVLLPLLDGTDMVEKIKENNANLPIIFLTNVKDANCSDAIKGLKNIDYLIKSDVHLDDIVKRAKKLLKMK